MLAMTLETIRFPSEQKIKDSVAALGAEVELPEASLTEIENLGIGVAAASSIAPTLVAGMATVVTFKEDNLTVVMFFTFAFFGLLYMNYLSRSLHILTNKIPRPRFLLKQNPARGAWSTSWARAISIQNLVVNAVLLALVLAHHIA